jgi:hypothetical protein
MIPATYVWLLVGIMIVTVIAVRSLAGPVRSVRRFLDLFFMGAAFLLLETKSVATFALLFGTTWLVNAFVFAGVIVVVLAAVEGDAAVPDPTAVSGLHGDRSVAAVGLRR